MEHFMWTLLTDFFVLFLDDISEFRYSFIVEIFFLVLLVENSFLE